MHTHDCQRCGASCQGLRVRVDEPERRAIEARASDLGITRPFSGPYLRQNWGTCVFYDQGCQLHARFGFDAKPSVCKRFPLLKRGIDPACFHPGPLLSSSAEPLEPDWDTLVDGERARVWLDRLPLAALLEGPVLGSLTTKVLRPLISLRPQEVPLTERAWIAAQIGVVVEEGLVPQLDPVAAIHGGAQLFNSVNPQQLAGWIRLLKLGLFGRAR